MLCRTANELYWMARHIERAENTARLLDVTYRRVASRSGGVGIRGAYEVHEAVARAIIAGDPAEASAAMAQHFAYSSEHPS